MAVELSRQPLPQACLVFFGLRLAKVNKKDAAAAAALVAATSIIGGGMTELGHAVGGGMAELGHALGKGTAEHGRAVGDGMKAIASSLSGVGEGVLGRGSADCVEVGSVRPCILGKNSIHQSANILNIELSATCRCALLSVRKKLLLMLRMDGSWTRSSPRPTSDAVQHQGSTGHCRVAHRKQTVSGHARNVVR